MKKIIAITLLLALALCLCACGNNNKEARYVGTWETYDKSVSMQINADGTATLTVTGENAGTYNATWVAENAFNMILKWDGAPVEPEVTEEETTEEVTDVTEEVTTEDVTTEDVTTEDVTTEETLEAVTDVEKVPVEEGAADAAATDTTGTAKRNDPSVIGYGSFKVVEGQIWLFFSEGSNQDVLLFTYAMEKVA